MDTSIRVDGLVVVAYDSDTRRFIGVINECSFPFLIREAILRSVIRRCPSRPAAPRALRGRRYNQGHGTSFSSSEAPSYDVSLPEEVRKIKSSPSQIPHLRLLGWLLWAYSRCGVSTGVLIGLCAASLRGLATVSRQLWSLSG